MLYFKVFSKPFKASTEITKAGEYIGWKSLLQKIMIKAKPRKYLDTWKYFQSFEQYSEGRRIHRLKCYIKCNLVEGSRCTNMWQCINIIEILRFTRRRKGFLKNPAYYFLGWDIDLWSIHISKEDSWQLLRYKHPRSNYYKRSIRESRLHWLLILSIDSLMFCIRL